MGFNFYALNTLLYGDNRQGRPGVPTDEAKQHPQMCVCMDWCMPPSDWLSVHDSSPLLVAGRLRQGRITFLGVCISDGLMLSLSTELQAMQSRPPSAGLGWNPSRRPPVPAEDALPYMYSAYTLSSGLPYGTQLNLVVRFVWARQSQALSSSFRYVFIWAHAHFLCSNFILIHCSIIWLYAD